MNTPTSVSDILNQIPNPCCICQEPIKKPVAVLECNHILHFNCAIGFFAIDGYNTCPVKKCQNRIKNIEAVEEDIGDLAEALKPGNTPKVKSFLREISKDLPHSDASSEMEEIPPSTAQGFLLLYENIDQAEKLLSRSERNVIRAKKEVILSYYQFGKADAEKLNELLKISIPLRTAQNKIVADVKKLLPSGTSVNVIKRRIATARKIYDIFSTIGEDKIQRIRNFSASSIGAFKKDEIEFIKTGDNKPKFRTERESVSHMDDIEMILDEF